ncbi:MAG: cytochrome c biogenesis protein CcsA [Bacteroidota bacterium]|jgi:cytochrome c-type biogenesis protein CcsB|nr:cytochrome c biogenesis protein CcsA [Bacteroidota bacterium]HHU95976.1 cytochrome c biogenesis protein CcsA [Petrimonas sp.]
MERILKFFSSYRGTIVLLTIYAVGLASATFIEKTMGTEAAKMLIYYSPLFIFFQFLMVLNFLLLLFRKKWFHHQKWALLVIHFALIVILGGALTTHLFGKEGQVHIREGERSDQMVMYTSKGVHVERLPFELELVKFTLNRYPGSQSPSSYESDLLVHLDGEVREARVFMNNVLDLKGYRFFQASYDSDEKGTILSVNRDVAGRTITYTGYLLLIIGFVLIFFVPNSRFRTLLRKLREVRKQSEKVLLFACLCLFSSMMVSGQEIVTDTVLDASLSDSLEVTQALGEASSVTAGLDVSYVALETALQNAVPAEHAARFGALPVQFRGRVMPMNTFSSEILRKLHKERRFEGLNSDQFLLSFFALPHVWSMVPFIVVGDELIPIMYGLPGRYASYSDFFDEGGHYRLLPLLQEAFYRPPNERSTLDKELINLDERVNIVYQLFNYSLPGIYPDPSDPTHTWYAPGEELDHFPQQDSLFITQTFSWYLSEVGHSVKSGDWDKVEDVLALIEAYQLKNDKAQLINPKKLRAEVRYNEMNIFGRTKVGYFILGGLLLLVAMAQLLRNRSWFHYASLVFTIGIILLFLYHMFGMGLRWYISGYAPWSNSYETMVYIAWATVLAGLLFGRRNNLTLALATLFGGVILFVSGLNWMDPQINTLVPVLKSPWLMFHVAVIVAAYGFFGISFLLGITNLSLMAFTKNDTAMTYRVKELSIINNLSLLVGLALMTTGTFLGAVWANESWGRYWGWDPKETWALITVVVYAIVTHIHLVKKGNRTWLFNFLSVLAFSSVLMTFLGVNYFLSGMHSYGHTSGSIAVFLYIAAAFGLILLLGIRAYRKSVISNP